MYLKIILILSCHSLRHEPWPSFTKPYLSTAPLSRLTPFTPLTLSRFTSHLSPFTFHLSRFTDSCAKIRGLSDLAILNRAFSPWMFRVSRFPFHFLTSLSHLSPPTVPSLRDSACVLILRIRRLYRRLPICRSYRSLYFPAIVQHRKRCTRKSVLSRLINLCGTSRDFVHHTLPFHRYPFTSHSSHNSYSLTLFRFTFHFSRFTDSCAKRSEALQTSLC